MSLTLWSNFTINEGVRYSRPVAVSSINPLFGIVTTTTGTYNPNGDNIYTLSARGEDYLGILDESSTIISNFLSNASKINGAAGLVLYGSPTNGATSVPGGAFFFGETSANSNTYNISYQPLTYSPSVIAGSGPAVLLSGTTSTLVSGASNITSYDWDYTNSNFILGYETTTPGATTKDVYLQAFSSAGSALGPSVDVAPSLPVGALWAVRATTTTSDTFIVENNSVALAAVDIKAFSPTSKTLAQIGSIQTGLGDITALPSSLNLSNNLYAFAGKALDGTSRIEFDTVNSAYSVTSSHSITLAGTLAATRIVSTALPNGAGGVFAYTDPNNNHLHLVQVDASSNIVQDLIVGDTTSGADRLRSFGDGRIEVEWRSVVSGSQNEVHFAIYDTRTAGISLAGTGSDDVLAGTPYSDTISGSAGNDRIAGSSGSDVLNGGAGSDTALFSLALSAAKISYDASYRIVVDAPNVHTTLSNFESFQFSDGTAHLWQVSPVNLQDFGFSQGWGSADNPRQLADADHNGSADYLAFGANYTFIASGGTFADGQGNLGPGFANPIAVIHDFGTNQGYTAEAQRGAAATGVGTNTVIYGQGNAGIYWYDVQSRASQTDAAGHTYSVPTYSSTPHLYADFGTQQGWTIHNGFQIVKASSSDVYTSVLGFGNNGIVVGEHAFEAFASASNYVIPFAAGNANGWDQTVDVRTFQDNKGNTLDLNHDGFADFLGMGPQGTAFAFGTKDSGGHYGLGQLQTATFGGNASDLGRAKGWTDQDTLRVVVHNDISGYDDIFAFGGAGVYVAQGQDPGTHGSQPFGALHLGIADFGIQQGWSNDLTPRLVGDVNGDHISDIVGFGANSTFVALGSLDSTGSLHFALDPSKTINDFGYNEGWNANTLRTLADVDGSGHDSLVLSGGLGTQIWHI